MKWKPPITVRPPVSWKNPLLDERLLKSNDKDGILPQPVVRRRTESPTEIVKDSMYLEFPGQDVVYICRVQCFYF